MVRDDLLQDTMMYAKSLPPQKQCIKSVVILSSGPLSVTGNKCAEVRVRTRSKRPLLFGFDCGLWWSSLGGLEIWAKQQHLDLGLLISEIVK